MTADKVELIACLTRRKELPMKNSKLTAAASFEGLCNRFEVYATGVDKLNAAIEDGTVDSILQECADVMYGGDMKPVRAQFGRVISSQKCNAEKRGVNTLIDRRRKDAIMLLEAYHKAAIGTSSSKGRKVFEYTSEEVDQLVANEDVEGLQRFYNNIYSRCSKGLEYDDKVLVHCSEQLSKLKAARKAAGVTAKATAPVVSEKLLGKLNGGKATSLSKAEVAELLKLLNK